MKYVTRFNPTANGELHLGHVYIMLFNEWAAHQSGGEFLVRFEDNQVDTLHSMSARQTRFYADRQRKAIEWLGIFVDDYQLQSELDIQVREFVAHHGWFIPEYKWPYSIPINPAYGDYNIEQGEWFPYAPHVTYHKVIYDELAGVNVLVRGDDLRSEFSLYQHYRTLFGLKEIEHYYLPRVYGPDDQIVSKFYGARHILDYQDKGWRPADIIELLAESALKNPADGWQLTNVKRYPRLDKAFYRQDSQEVGVYDLVSVGGIDGDLRRD
jgi:glutamyl/glutaminyl-tRNA synthetase